METNKLEESSFKLKNNEEFIEKSNILFIGEIFDNTEKSILKQEMPNIKNKIENEYNVDEIYTKIIQPPMIVYNNFITYLDLPILKLKMENFLNNKNQLNFISIKFNQYSQTIFFTKQNGLNEYIDYNKGLNIRLKLADYKKLSNDSEKIYELYATIYNFLLIKYEILKNIGYIGKDIVPLIMLCPTHSIEVSYIDKEELNKLKYIYLDSLSTQTDKYIIDNIYNISIIVKNNQLFSSKSCDAIVTNISNIILLAPSADCISLLFSPSDKNSNIIGLAHAGWRGAIGYNQNFKEISENNIISETIKVMRENGVDGDIQVAISPHIANKNFLINNEEELQNILLQYNNKFNKYNGINENNIPYFNLTQYVIDECKKLDIEIVNENSLNTEIYNTKIGDIYFSHQKTQEINNNVNSLDRGMNASSIIKIEKSNQGSFF